MFFLCVRVFFRNLKFWHNGQVSICFSKNTKQMTLLTKWCIKFKGDKPGEMHLCVFTRD